ncbi:GNAT family N-acetyltransferase [Marivirga salinae]|uniref:GNAT family N-acetyltransferase n=1 Tax=Marivirga salinarum TaxID=3059078 RepID=A0AA51NDZ6_9BACT|nr:GNAT family N-acetyltransferase [Marivirga sp. BDSF4-3]WMN12086.1 GNAT family N-acetyltransferase [Marivirga sp. BDSF4-3]
MEIYLKTERLEIRPINLLDAGFFNELVNTKSWKKYIGERNISTVSEAEVFIQNILKDVNLNYHVFELKDSQTPVGIITFLKRETEEYPDFGFAMLPEFEGVGMAFEACMVFLEKIRSLHNYDNIIAITIPSNNSSISLLKKLGFVYTGDIKKEGNMLSYYNLK